MNIIINTTSPGVHIKPGEIVTFKYASKGLGNFIPLLYVVPTKWSKLFTECLLDIDVNLIYKKNLRVRRLRKDELTDEVKARIVAFKLKE